MTKIILLDSTSDKHPSIVATSNAKHLSLFVDAKNWQDI